MCGDAKIIRVSTDNYHIFDDMVFYRMNGRDRNTDEQQTPRDFAQVFHTLVNPNLFVYAAELEDRFVAWISLVYLPKVGRTNGKGYIYVDELWTSPECRRKGIARALMKKADDLRDELQAVGIRLYVSEHNPDAIALYGGCGYTPHGDKSYFMSK